jgi:fatty acid desaturase
MMSEHDKKKIAPIVITIIVVLYYILYFTLVIFAVPGILTIIFGIVPLLLAGLMIYVCVQRMKEIDGGEEDDLSKY